MENLEQIVAHNLTELRKEHKWTQAELAEKINYSDKSVSKWERGEGLPDVKVLQQMADLFGVTLDYFVSENAAEEKQKYDYPKSQRAFRIGTMLLGACTVWLIAAAIFFYTAIYSEVYVGGYWMVFLWAIPLSSLVLATCSRRWGFRVCTIVFRSILSWTLLVAIYLQLLIYASYNVWMIFLIGIPMQIIIILWALIQRHKQ